MQPFGANVVGWQTCLIFPACCYVDKLIVPVQAYAGTSRDRGLTLYGMLCLMIRSFCQYDRTHVP